VVAGDRYRLHTPLRLTVVDDVVARWLTRHKINASAVSTKALIGVGRGRERAFADLADRVAARAVGLHDIIYRWLSKEPAGVITG
jgi:hypothetical protein